MSKAKRLWKKTQDMILSLVLGVIIIFAWQQGGLHYILGLKPYQLSYPSDIIRTLNDDFSVIMSNTVWTLKEAVVGILVGSLIGFVIAVFAAAFPKLVQLLSRLIRFSSSMRKMFPNMRSITAFTARSILH